MGGGWETYYCARCPLAIELGGATFWNDAGDIIAVSSQVACEACGTLHRIIEEPGLRRVTALPGPLRSSRTVTLRDVAGEEFETIEWFREDEWLPVSWHPVQDRTDVAKWVGQGIRRAEQLACSHCDAVGKMLTYEGFRGPGGYVPGEPRREKCPLCGGPMPCVAVSDAI